MLSIFVAVPLVAATLSYASAVEVFVPRAEPGYDLVPRFQDGAALMPRADHNKSFDIGFSAQNTVLYSADWTAPKLDLTVPGSPFQVMGTEHVSFSVQCVDCRTFGTVVADLNDDNTAINASLIFKNVGAHVDLGLAASSKGTFSIALGHFFGESGNITGGAFSADLGLGLELVFELDAAVELTGGFQISIPDGSEVGFGIDFGLIDGLSTNVASFPKVNFGLLPIAMNDTSANVTISLVLKADAGIDASLKGLAAANVGAGASLTIVSVNLGAIANVNSTCKTELFIGVDSNAGAYAKAGASIASESFSTAPAVSTTFATAGFTTCLGTNTKPNMAVTGAASSSVAGGTAATATAAGTTMPTTVGASGSATSTAAPAPTSGSGSAASSGACLTALQTITTAITSAKTLTSCVAQVANCPASLTQLIIVTDIESSTIIQCPQSRVGAARLAKDAVTVPTATSLPISSLTQSLTALATPIVASLPSSIASLTGSVPSPTITDATVKPLPTVLAGATTASAPNPTSVFVSSVSSEVVSVATSLTSEIASVATSLASAATSLVGAATSVIGNVFGHNAAGPRAEMASLMGTSAAALVGMAVGVALFL